MWQKNRSFYTLLDIFGQWDYRKFILIQLDYSPLLSTTDSQLWLRPVDYLLVENSGSGISCLFVSDPERVSVQNLSYESVFSLQGSFSCKSNSFSHERLCTGTRFQTEAQGNSEMAHWHRQCLPNTLKFPVQDELLEVQGSVLMLSWPIPPAVRKYAITFIT